MLKALSIILLLMPTATLAAVPALCPDAPNQAEGTACAGRKLVEADAEMNRVYAELKAKLDDLGRRHLEKAEAAWIRFRDAECDLETGHDPPHDGTIMPMLLDECAVDWTERRTRDLKEQLLCPGGNLSCEAR